MASAPSTLPEVPLAPGTLAIGDLHLDVAPGAAAPEGFVAWTRALEGVPRLIVLGDLFDAWVGPAHARLEPARRVAAALRALVERGCAVEVLHGNRDFLLGEGFERESGARVRPAGLVGRLPGGERVLFVHGDELCTLDLGYQRLKRVLRSAPVRWAAPRLPGAAALWFAGRLRSRSIQAVAAKPQARKEQQAAAVRALAAAQGCGQLVCGHAHRFRDERLPAGPRWWVVDAFGQGRDVLRVGPRGGLEPAGSASADPAGAFTASPGREGAGSHPQG